MKVSAARYRVIALAALCALIAIVITGNAVRLTGSGLGCDDWPACNNERLIDVSSSHAAIEQVNRLFTGVVSAAVIAAVLGSLRRVPYRRDIVWLSVGLVAGVVGQVVLGGITVLVELHPAAVQAHFLLSMVLVANAVALVHRASEPDDGRLVRPASPEVSRHTIAAALLTAVAVVTGTVVTGAGPHAGDEDARRFGVDIAAAARVHGITVIVTVAVVLALMWRLRTRRAEREQLGEWVSAWVFVALLQGAVGYIQYLNSIPPLLVGVHVFGATMLWTVSVALVLRTRPLRRSLAASGHAATDSPAMAAATAPPVTRSAHGT